MSKNLGKEKQKETTADNNGGKEAMNIPREVRGRKKRPFMGTVAIPTTKTAATVTTETSRRLS